MIKCSRLVGLFTRLMVCQSEYGCSSIPPLKGSISPLPQIICPPVESSLAEITCSSQYGLLTRLMMFQSAYGCPLFPPPEGSIIFSAREYILPSGYPLWQSRMNDSALHPRLCFCSLMTLRLEHGCSLFLSLGVCCSLCPRLAPPPGESSVTETGE